MFPKKSHTVKFAQRIKNKKTRRKFSVSRAKFCVFFKSSTFSAFSDTHRERLVFYSIQYRNGWLAAPDLFHMFRQSIKFYTFHYQYRCLKNVIHQIESKNGWLLLSTSLWQNLRQFLSQHCKALFLIGFIREDFQNSPRSQ